jgi:ABC-type Mn2+/Zn2+ transport system ATPase subunit
VPARRDTTRAPWHRSLQKAKRRLTHILRRLMLAVGLLTPQPLLLMDEPVDGFDLRQTRNIISLSAFLSRMTCFGVWV